MAGVVGIIDDRWVSGWAFDPERPTARMVVEVMVGNLCVSRQEASIFRQHLADAGLGDGKVAFAMRLSEQEWALLTEKRGTIAVIARHPDNGTAFTLPLAPKAQSFLKRPVFRTGFLTDATPNVQLAAICIIKNEAHYVEEWIAYHLARGVQYFVFYDNGSSDDLGRTLWPYVQRGIARIIPWPNFVHDPDVRARAWHEQNAAYAHALRILSGVAAWIIVLDIDEFIATADDRSVPTILDPLSGHDVLTAFWRFFGSSGHEATQPGLVIDTFTHRKADGDARGSPYKFIARPESVAAVLNTHTPVMAADGAIGATLGGERFWTAARACELADFSTIWIHHYHVKSREEYKAKVIRGWPENTPTKNVNWEGFFKMHDNNDVHDPSMRRYSGQTLGIIDAMRASPMRPAAAPDRNRELVVRVNVDASGDDVEISGFAIDLARPGERVLLRIENIFGQTLQESVCDLPDTGAQTNGFADGKYLYKTSVTRAGLPFDQVRIRLDDTLFCRTVREMTAN